MSTFRDKVDHFLFRFGYSIKIKSIILLAAFTAIFVAVMLIIAQQRLLSSATKQEFGIRYQQELNALLGTVLVHEIASNSRFADPSSKEQHSKFDNKIAVLLDRLKALTFDEAPDYVGQRAAQELQNNFSLIATDLTADQEMRSRQPSAVKIIQNLRKLSNTTSRSFDLSTNIDTGMHYLLKSYTEWLPEIEVLTFELATTPEFGISLSELTPEEASTVMILKETLADHFRALERDLFLASQENSFIHTFLQSSEMQKGLEEYHLAYQNLLEQVYPDGNPSSMQNLIEAGMQSIEKSNALNRLIGSEAATLLETQSDTLLVREYYGVGFIIFGVVVMLAAYMTRIIRRPLAGIRHAAEELAKGKVGVRIEVQAKDEVGQICDSFNQLVERIEIIIQEADGISSKLAISSKGIFTTAKQLESNVIRQEQAITQIASNAKGVSRTVQDFARSLQEVHESATVTAHLAALGQASLNEMENIMHQMAKASMSIVKTLSDLQDKVGKINTIISTIVRIADQINLLSLNTAIRAGKKGVENLGFSVIADKISELADQTALATLDIEELVQKIIQMVSTSVAIVDNFSDQIRNQVFESTEIGEELKKLIANTRQQFEVFDAVNRSMQEQTARAQQIHESISLLTETAQSTTHSVRNLYLEIEYLHHSTNNLKIMTRKLTEESYEELSSYSS